MGSAIFLGAVVIVILVWGAFTRHRLAYLRTKAEAAWADIDAQLTRRRSLVPVLAEAVRDCTSNETAVFDRVEAVKARALDATTPPEHAAAAAALNDALFPLFAIAEGCPALRASEHFAEIRRGLEEAEDAIQRAKRVHNAAVHELNAGIGSFPRSLVAGLFGFRPRRYYALPGDEERQAARARL